MDHRLEWAGEQNSMSTGFLWRIDWAADSEPNSMTFRLGWRMDHGLGLGRRTKFHDDWISSRMEDSADSDPNLTTTVQVFQWMIDWPLTRNIGFDLGFSSESIICRRDDQKAGSL